MNTIPFVGESYPLGAGKASISRSINCYPVKTLDRWIMPAVDGLTSFCDLGATIRGCIVTNDRLFFVAGDGLYEVDRVGASTRLGSILSSVGRVQMAYGTSQLVIVDGYQNGHVLTLGTNALTEITSSAFYGSPTVTFLDNYFHFVRPDTGQFYISAINDATTLDALDFATAESQPDNLVAIIAVQRRLFLLGQFSTEVYFNSGDADFPFEREGPTIEVGCLAPNSAQGLDNTAFMIGCDKNGGGRVYRLNGYQWAGVSTQAVDEALQQSTDLPSATAYVYQKNGLTFYAINAPGLKSTWVYEVASDKWHERCDLDAMGQLTAHRAVCHAFAFGKHLVGGSDGVVYVMDSSVYTTAGDARVVERISPHWVAPNAERVRFNAFHLNVTTGDTPQGEDPFVELSWSDDSGANWSNPVPRSLGKVGERFPRISWYHLGISRDRVWKVRFNANARFDLVNADVETA